MVPPLRQGHLKNSSHGQPWWVAAQVTGQKAFPKGAGAEMAAAQLVPRAEGQQTVTAKGHQLSGREAPPVCDTCHGAQSPGCPQQCGQQALLMCQSWWVPLALHRQAQPPPVPPHHHPGTAHSLPAAAPTVSLSQRCLQVGPNVTALCALWF